MNAPRSTYRLQIRRSFDLNRAAGILDYLRDLGVDWVYVSPLLKAEPGSDHGYDVIDYSVVDPERGGPEGLEAFSAAAHRAGMGVLGDIVPNHMGVATPELNRWWWELLAGGQGSPRDRAFDVDWDFGGSKVRIPVLGDGEDEPGKLTVDAEGRLCYFENRYPIAPGTLGAPAGADPSSVDPVAVHARQHYELVNWRRADAELNYRRFFAVNSLAAVRVEIPEVFEESHSEIGRWFAEGLVDGLRVDHPDGLRDPGEYLSRLARLTRNAYVVVEKILHAGETLPEGWQTAGTTGYDVLGDIDRVLVNPDGEADLDRIDSELAGRPDAVSWADLIHETKLAVARGILRSEVLRLARLVPGVERAEEALAEIMAGFSVYRSYLPQGLGHLEQAVAAAHARRPDLGAAFDSLLPLLSDPDRPVAQRFQQTSGMVMAKGVEDAAFYRYTRLTSLTEVGGDPSIFSIGAEEFHRRAAGRAERSPESMTTLSTHDTKRGEDVRARISVLSEVPERWAAFLRRVGSRAPLPDGSLSNLLWQAIVGAWPASRERLHAYAEKAAREAGTSTNWTAPDEVFEAALHALVDSCFDDAQVREAIEEFVGFVAPAGWSNSLTAKLLQLAGPGVPDVYQGSELWETSLVDPDNRRPVDFDRRREMLAAIDAGELPPVDDGGAAKLLVTSRALRLRRDRSHLFSVYLPLHAAGPAAPHFIGFDRGGALTLGTRLPVGLAASGGWGETVLTLPAGSFVDQFSGRVVRGTIRLAELFERYPVALLAPEGI